LSQASFDGASRRRQDDLQAAQNPTTDLHDGESYAFNPDEQWFSQDDDLLIKASDAPTQDPGLSEQNSGGFDSAHDFVERNSYIGDPEALYFDANSPGGTQSDISSDGNSDDSLESDAGNSTEGTIEESESEFEKVAGGSDDEELADDYLSQKIDDTVAQPEINETPYLSDPEIEEDGKGGEDGDGGTDTGDGFTDEVGLGQDDMEIDTEDAINLEKAQDPPEDEEGLDSTEIESFPHAGEVKKSGRPYFAKLVLSQTNRGARSPYTPFTNASEFDFVKWANKIPISKVDSLLKLDWVSN
jgi:hypothetical protein